MTNEIKRNNWSRFCKKFNVTNQFRMVTVYVQKSDGREVILNQSSPFLGITLSKKGRFIDGVELFTGQADPDQISQPTVTVTKPVKVMLEKDSRGMDHNLAVESEDGTRVRVDFFGEKDLRQCQTLIEKVAYSMYEKRGFTTGNDVEDWLSAERKIREIEHQFVS